MLREVVIKNKSWKKMQIFKDNKEIVSDAIKEFAYANYKGDLFSIDFFGKIGKDFRILALIGESDNKNNLQNNKIFSINKNTLDKEIDFGIYDISENLNIDCVCIKFDENTILKEILKYISQEKFNGGYYAKGKFYGENIDDLIFLGVSGDYRDKRIRNINLDKLFKKSSI
ncbi:MAG: hypothetical protein LBI78_05870 [Campylobacteraceae bacterium]|jgi:hypothetical protein|nr:hypothetical protein [Campylobacteraceae bacterium]